MNSSAPVAARSCSRPRRTLSGAPTTDTDSIWSSPAASCGDIVLATSSTGGPSRPGWPRRTLRNWICIELNRRAASASVSATMAFTPIIAYGCSSTSDGVKRSR
jgi:hypothetical protein